MAFRIAPLSNFVNMEPKNHQLTDSPKNQKYGQKNRQFDIDILKKADYNEENAEYSSAIMNNGGVVSAKERIKSKKSGRQKRSR